MIYSFIDETILFFLLKSKKNLTDRLIKLFLFSIKIAFFKSNSISFLIFTTFLFIIKTFNTIITEIEQKTTIATLKLNNINR